MNEDKKNVKIDFRYIKRSKSKEEDCDPHFIRDLKDDSNIVKTELDSVACKSEKSFNEEPAPNNEDRISEIGNKYEK
jgi:hypothetical protein